MDWSPHLAAGENVRWEGRPAPRCYTFRNWRHSLFGLLLLVLTVYWQIIGFELAHSYGRPYLAWIPSPFLLAAGYLSIGHLLLARLEWEGVFYAVTDRRVLALRRRRLRACPIDAVSYFRIEPFGEDLGTVRLTAEGLDRPLTLHCLEYPRRATDLVEAALAARGALAASAGQGGEID